MTRHHFLNRLSRFFKEEKSDHYLKPKELSEKIEIEQEPRYSSSSTYSTQSTISTCDNSMLEELPIKISLAEQVRTILGDAIEIADRELEKGY